MRYALGLFMSLALIAAALVLDPDPRTHVPMRMLAALGIIWVAALLQLVCSVIWGLDLLLARDAQPQRAIVHDVRG